MSKCLFKGERGKRQGEREAENTLTVLSDTGYGGKDAVRILIRGPRLRRVGSKESILVEVCWEEYS